MRRINSGTTNPHACRMKLSQTFDLEFDPRIIEPYIISTQNVRLQRLIEPDQKCRHPTSASNHPTDCASIPIDLDHKTRLAGSTEGDQRNASPQYRPENPLSALHLSSGNKGKLGNDNTLALWQGVHRSFVDVNSEPCRNDFKLFRPFGTNDFQRGFGNGIDLFHPPGYQW